MKLKVFLLVVTIIFCVNSFGECEHEEAEYLRFLGKDKKRKEADIDGIPVAVGPTTTGLIYELNKEERFLEASMGGSVAGLLAAHVVDEYKRAYEARSLGAEKRYLLCLAYASSLEKLEKEYSKEIKRIEELVTQESINKLRKEVESSIQQITETRDSRLANLFEEQATLANQMRERILIFIEEYKQEEMSKNLDCWVAQRKEEDQGYRNLAEEHEKIRRGIFLIQTEEYAINNLYNLF